MPPRPHILLIVLDTLRRDRLTAYDPALPTGPHLAEFAHRAYRFERAVAPAQWTIPAHASLFTGTYPGQHGVTQSISALSPATPTLAEILRAQGYRTAAFCNNPLVGVLENGLQRGFTEFYNYASAVPYRPNADRQPYLKREFLRWFRPHARRIGNQFARHDWLFAAALAPLWTPLWTKYINFKGSTRDSIGDLIDWLAAHEAGGAPDPAFVFVNLMDAHLPYHPPRQALDRVGARLDPADWRFVQRFNADAAAWASPPEPPLTAEQQRALLAFYDAEIAHQDEHLGRLIAYLRRSGLLEKTVVIIAADHGEGHGEHDLFGHGFNVHQELVHVPLLIHLPDGGSGRVTANISTRRLYHTILDLAGRDDPAVEALTLTREMTGTASADLPVSEAVPVTTFLHVLEKRNPLAIERMALRETRRAVYAGDHKLIVRGDQIEALYDVAADPAETRDLTLTQPEIAADLRRRLADATADAIADAIGDDADDPARPAAYADDDAAVLEHLRALGYVD
ncbi:MAG: sulfatase [Candidatus Flexifilum sp.]